MSAGVRAILRAAELEAPGAAARSINGILLGIYLRLEALERAAVTVAAETASGGGSVSQSFTDGSVLATTITVLASGSATLLPTSALSDRRRVTLKNKGQAVVYVGGAGVTATKGLPLEIGEQLDLSIGPNALVYGVVAAGDTDVDVRVLEFAE